MVKRFLTLAAVFGLCAQAQAVNLLQPSDIGFEAGKGTWAFSTNAPAVGTFDTAAAAKHSGSFGARVVVTTKDSLHTYGVQLIVPTNWKVDSGKTYHLSFWGKASGTKPLTVNINRAGNYKTNGITNTLSTAWKQYEATYKADTSNATGGIGFYFALAADTGTYDFDDFVIDSIATTPPGPVGANLLTNGGFESVDTAGWEIDRPDSITRGSVTFNAAAMRTGDKGLQATITKVDTANWGIRVYMPAFAATAGNTYTISFWAKSDSIRPVTIGFQPAGGGYISASPEQNTTTSWTKFSYKVMAATTASLQFNIYLGDPTSGVGVYSFDDFYLDETVALVIPPLVLPELGAWYTGKYRNLFVERGYSAADVQAKVNADFQQLFFGDSSKQSIYRTVGSDEAFIDGIDTSKYENGEPKGADIRTEGMSYGMMIAVQLNRQDVFNKLWKFAKTRMQNTSGDGCGYFAWRLSNVAPFTAYDKNPAPDGEEYFVSSLFLADKRWGSAPGTDDYLNYKQQADSLLTYMIMPRTGAIGPLVDPTAKQIVFSPAQPTPYTDASYHIPAFYRMWAAFSSHHNALWAEMADTSLAFWKRHMDATTGLNSDKALFDGTPNSVTYYSYDAHRTPMYVGMDYAWFKADPWEVLQTKRNLGFFDAQGAYKDNYNLDGTTPASTPVFAAGSSQVGANAAAVLASDTIRDWRFVDDLWTSEPPTDNWRYYGGLVRMLGLLHTSGNFKAWGSPGNPTSVAPSRTVASSFSARLVGNSLRLDGLTGTVRLLNAQGREVGRQVVVGSASVVLPHAGLWVIDAGTAGHRSIVMP